MLHRLVRSNLLIIPLDTPRPGLPPPRAAPGDARVRARPTRCVGVSAPSRRGRASWFREKGDVDRAISHAIQAGDRERVRRADLAQRRPRTSRPAAHATVRGWLANFTEEQVSASPPLCLARATAYLAAGNGGEVERWTGIALDRLDEDCERGRRGDGRSGPHHPGLRRRARGRGEDARGRAGRLSSCWRATALGGRFAA